MSEAALREEVFQRVRKVIAEVLKIGEDQISLESRFVEDLKADSFDSLSLLMSFEEEFDRPIEVEGILELDTVGSTVDFILRQAEQDGVAPVTSS